MNYNINGTSVDLKMINRNYRNMKARRFLINNTNQNIWIPKGYVNQDGTIKECYFKYNQHKFKEILYKASLRKVRKNMRKNNKNKWFDCAKLPKKVIKVYDRLNREACKILKMKTTTNE